MTAREAYNFFKKPNAHDLDTPQEISECVEAYLTTNGDPPHSALWLKRYACLSHATSYLLTQYCRLCFKTPWSSPRERGHVMAQQVPVTSYPTTTETARWRRGKGLVPSRRRSWRLIPAPRGSSERSRTSQASTGPGFLRPNDPNQRHSPVQTLLRIASPTICLYLTRIEYTSPILFCAPLKNRINESKLCGLALELTMASSWYKNTGWLTHILSIPVERGTFHNL